MRHIKPLQAQTMGRGRRLALVLAIAAITGSAQAAPTDGIIIDGAANITYTDTTTNINQSTQNVTINWQDFDIDIDETVTFFQPNAESMALNRVLTGDGTQILGNLNANGRVFVLDANGVLFGQNAQVNVGSLVASTLDINNSDFVAGDYTFTAFTGAGTPGSVLNLGEINAIDGGVVALLGGQVSNQGVIRANLGSVALAAGNKITLDFAGDGLLNVQIDEAVANALAHNGGLIQANGGSVLMTAHASNTLLQTVVNNEGVIEAQTLVEQDGHISLLGGFNGGEVSVGGVLDASAPNGGNGGFVETSGAVVNIQPQTVVTTDAPEGKTGLWLIDPTDIEISYEGENNGVSHVSTQALQNSLATSNVTVQTIDAGGGNGDITIVDPIVWATTNTLTFDADGDIAINDYIHAPDGGLTLSAITDITTGIEGHISVASFVLNNGSWSQVSAVPPEFLADDFILNGGTFIRATAGNGIGSPLQISDIYGLQGLNTTPTYNAVLQGDIDASNTINWNSGAGFDPITDYSGGFNGDGFTIENIVINRPTQDEIGLFGRLALSGEVSNIGLIDGTITGQNNVGGLVGRNNGVISTSYSTVDVLGNDSVGGLVGLNETEISTSYSTGSVTGVNNTGGLIGTNSPLLQIPCLPGPGCPVFPIGVDTSYAAGPVNGALGVTGGLIGANLFSGVFTLSNSYFDSHTTQQAVGIGLGGGPVTAVDGNWVVAPDAYNEATYTNLNFTNDWFISEGLSRPMLRAFLDGNNISNIYQLQGMSADLTGSYTLTQNVDASATAASVAAGNAGNFSDVWGGKGFASVGRLGSEFTGSLDGASFVIDGLQINRLGFDSATDDIGLIGRSNGGSINNLGLTNAQIIGGQVVGGLVGRNAGTITNSYVEGAIGALNTVGGLAGVNTEGGSITASYSTASASGVSNTGGLVGVNTGAGTFIDSSYATGTVSGGSDIGGLVGTNTDSALINTSYATGENLSGFINVGGLVGSNEGASVITNAYFDSFTTGLGTGIGLDANAQTVVAVNGDWNNIPNAYNQASYTGFNFTDDWFIAENTSRPMLRAFLDGTTISNLYHLQGIAADLTATYTLTQNIDASATAASVLAGNAGNFSDTWGGQGFAPMGVFTGTLNGADYIIDGLEVFRPTQSGVGVFSVLAGTVTSLGFINSVIEGQDSVGGIAGELNGGTITNTYSVGSVEGANTVGGLVGQNTTGVINTSYSAGTIAGSGINVGGLVGFNENEVNNSFSLGVVSAGNAGGLIGNNVGVVSNAFWNTDNTTTGIGSGNQVGATGLTTSEFTDLANFAAWGTSIDNAAGTGSTWRIYDGHTAPLLRSFLTEIDVIAYDDARTYNGNSYVGLHQINGTQGNGVRYGRTYAEFLDVFGQDGTPYAVDDVNSADLEYVGNSQGAIDAGFYDITPDNLWSSQQGYDINNVDGLLNINAQALTVVAIDDKTKEYGTVDPALTWQITQGVLAPGDTLTGSLSRSVGEDVGAYSISGNLTGDLVSGNYNITLINGAFTITPRAITVDIANANRPYGDDDPAFTWSIASGNLLAGDELTGVLNRAAGENVGDYAITGNVGNSNYAVTLNNGVLTITPRPIIIDITSFNKLYGDDDPTFTWNVTDGDLVFDETLTGTLTRAAGENVGDYAITGIPDNDVAGGNYAVTLNEGVLTITPRPITIQADDLMRVYGAEDPEFTWSIASGTILNGDAVTVNLTREPGENVRPEGYAIAPDVAGDVISDNYQITLLDGVLQITPAPLTVTANNVTSYWDLLPEFTATTEGLVLEDTVTDAFGDSLIVTSNLVLPLPDDYTLTPNVELATNNYTVGYETGTLTLLSSKGPDIFPYLPQREALGRQNRANIYEARELLDGRGDSIELLVLDGGQKLDPEKLKSLGIPLPELVLFPINGSVLTYEQNIMLKKLVRQMAEFPSLKLLVEGHTSNTGSAALNDPLSKRRARVVAEALVKFGLDENRVRTKNYGYRRAAADNKTLEGRALNRRAEINEDKTQALAE